jgi:hypothetical protein
MPFFAVLVSGHFKPETMGTVMTLLWFQVKEYPYT